MEAIRIRKIVETEGEIHLRGLPLRKGQQVEMIVLVEVPVAREHRPLTARQLLQSGLIGLWRDRTDIGDSVAFARRLREQAQRRNRE